MNKKMLKNSLKTLILTTSVYSWGGADRYYYRTSSGRQREWCSNFSIKSWFLGKNLSIVALLGVLSLPVAAHADVVRVNGAGAASCPSGYSLTGVIPNLSGISGDGSRSNLSGPGETFFKCSIGSTGVSACTRGVVLCTQWDDSGNRYDSCLRSTMRVYSAPITIICARTCSN